jgi:two-component system sensor histidine kinase UhpB
LEWQAGELSRVSWNLLEKQETTARRFSHELHDELGQSLTAVKANLVSLVEHANGGRAQLDDCLHLVDEAIVNVRELSQLLRPTILDDFGLSASLKWLAERFHVRTGIEVDFKSTLEGRLADETETHLFRIAQEALTNVARHSAARHVSLALGSQDGQVTLHVSDDGKGLVAGGAEAGRGLGMVGMRARARSAGGELKVESAPERGVAIMATFPFRARKD